MSVHLSVLPRLISVYCLLLLTMTMMTMKSVTDGLSALETPLN